MKREDLYEAISNIDSRYIEEADPARTVRRKRSIRPYLALAAAFVLVIGLAAIASQGGLLRMKSSDTAESAAATDLAETPELAAAPAEGIDEEAGAEYEEEAPAEDTAEMFEQAASEEAPAAEPAEAPAEEPADPALTAVIFWNGKPYVPDEPALLGSLPEECTLCDTLKDEPGAAYYTEFAELAGGKIWMPTEDVLYFFVEYQDGFQRYVPQSP